MSSQVETSENSNISVVAEEYMDLLDRKKLAKNFVSVLTTQKANVFSINGGWGTGKTWFLKFVEAECAEKKIPFVQYNVWENDYLNDPFSAIIAELSDLLGIGEDGIKELASKISLNASVGFMGNSVGFEYDPTKNIAEYKKLKTEKEIFKKLVKSKIKKSVIIAIDELDRCRPDYAIKTLEVIKHFFDIEGIKFILAVDKAQLARTVEVMFGQNTDAECYLRKFVDLEYNLPEPDKKEYIDYLIENKYSVINQRLTAFSQNNSILYWGWNYLGQKETWTTEARKGEAITYSKNNLYEILDSADYCLREIEKILLRLSIIFEKMSSANDILELGFLLELIILNLKKPAVYNEIQRGISFSTVISEKKWKEKYKRTTGLDNLIKSENSNNGNIIRREIPSLKKYYDFINFADGFE